jgi:hypothetical protein
MLCNKRKIEIFLDFSNLWQPLTSWSKQWIFRCFPSMHQKVWCYADILATTARSQNSGTTALGNRLIAVRLMTMVAWPRGWSSLPLWKYPSIRKFSHHNCNRACISLQLFDPSRSQSARHRPSRRACVDQRFNSLTPVVSTETRHYLFGSLGPLTINEPRK